MEDDFSKMKNYKKQKFTQILEHVNKTTATGQKPKERICFIITNNKSSSWVDDFQAQEKLNQMERIFH